MDENTRYFDDNPNKSEDTKAVESENKSAISADLIRGHINTIILRTLYERDKYGYEIIEEIESKSHGQYSLKQPTLYSALKRLETQGYINAYWKTDEISQGGRRKYYTLTDSGREITEKNQAEWEYSRTVIDNLISDRSFDFSQPAPNSVDFNILKKSTSRVPRSRTYDFDEDDEAEEIEQPKTKEPEDNSEEELFDAIPKLDIKREAITFSEQTVYFEPLDPTPVQPVAEPEEDKQEEIVTPEQTKAVVEQTETETEEVLTEVETVEDVSEPVDDETFEKQLEAIDGEEEQPEIAEVAETVETEQDEQPTDEEDPPMTEEQRRIVHENYLRLISEPVRKVQTEVEPVPVADDIDTDKLIYNNKPETERDYRNLINRLFIKTVKHNPTPEEAEPATIKQQASDDTEEFTAKANSDGLKLNSADYKIGSPRKKSYNRGSCLFKSSLIVSIVFLLEFTLCLLFKNELEVGLAYPFVILSIAATQLLIFGVLYYTDIGKYSRKPNTTIYLSASIIVTVILIFIIFIVSLLVGVNFASAGNVMSRIIIPCIVALNIPAFAICFYFFSK